MQRLSALITLYLLLFANSSFAQVGIGTITPNPKAALDISGPGKGLLIPRMDSITRVGIASPLPDGLMVYQTDGRKGFWYAVSDSWVYLSDRGSGGDNLGSHTATTDLGMNDFEVHFRSQGDTNHGIGWYGINSSTKNWLGQNIDGPVVYGNTGGVLGTKGGAGRKSVLSWNSSGRVGINNANPQQALDVTGTVRAQQFAYATPQTRYLSIPCDAFTSANESDYRVKMDVQTVLGANISTQLILTGGTTGQEGYVSAPVNLPQGALITNIELTAIDNDRTSVTPQLSLIGLQPSSGTYGLTLTLNAQTALTTESPNWQTASASVYSTVHNESSTYKVVVKLNQNSFATILYGVRITYTVNTPD